jgi:general secretion pathway protein A
VYTSFYGLKDEPFRLTPDPRYLHLSAPYQHALTAVLEGIIYRKGLVMITGPIGTGKTTLVNAVLQLLWDQKMPIKSALLFNPTLTREEFLEMLLEEFEVTCAATSKPKRLAALHHMLLDTQRQGGTSVLFIDEAHLLSSELLEEIRLLGNSDTHQEKPLQIVLSGQPELVPIMKRPELSALQQRIAIRAQLHPLSKTETSAYISERLHSAGLRESSPFPVSTVEAIYGFTQGVPRLLNLLCDGCLTLGFRAQRKTILSDIVEEVAVSLSLALPAPVNERKYDPIPELVGVGTQKTAVDILIEALKRNRSEVRE